MTASFSRAIVVGASSGMGEEIARQLAAAGCRVALVARRAADLSRIADELNAGAANAGEPIALTFTHDVTQYDDVPALFQQTCRELGGLDLIVYAAGVMPSVTSEEYDFAKDRAMVEVNFLGAVAWLNEAAQRFQAARGGTIVGISSVAADRGRRGKPVYGASKAALDTYLEALRNRVARFGVRVVTVKPGPVETPMTAEVDDIPRSQFIKVDEAARLILTAAAGGPLVAYVPAKWGVIMAVIRAIPSPIFRKMKL